MNWREKLIAFFNRPQQPSAGYWVCARGPTGEKQYVNLAFTACMVRTKIRVDTVVGKVTKELTMLIHGGMSFGPDGQAHYCNSQVLETPEQLFALPPVEFGKAQELAAAAANDMGKHLDAILKGRQQPRSLPAPEHRNGSPLTAAQNGSHSEDEAQESQS